MTSSSGRSGLPSRRAVLTGAVAGALTVPVLSGAALAASAIPKLPGEITRTTRTTKLGRKAYQCVDVAQSGDKARIFVPEVARPGSAVKVIWFFHSNGSTRTSMDGAYKYGGELAVDKGMICVCPDYAGSVWTTAPAIRFVSVWSTYVASLWTVTRAYARANSGGGSLMNWSAGNGLLPALRGIYLANATYDMEDLYARDPGRIGPVYGNDPAAIAATNPARLPQSAWSGVRMKTVVSLSDTVVPPRQHGLALAALAKPVAADVQIQYHDEGHVVPGWTQKDMVTTFTTWA